MVNLVAFKDRSLSGPTPTFTNGSSRNTRKVDHGWPPNPGLSMPAGCSLPGSGQPVHLGICDEPCQPHFKAAELKGHPSRSFAITSSPTFSQATTSQTVPQLLPKLEFIAHLSASQLMNSSAVLPHTGCLFSHHVYIFWFLYEKSCIFSRV